MFTNQSTFPVSFLFLSTPSVFITWPRLLFLLRPDFVSRKVAETWNKSNILSQCWTKSEQVLSNWLHTGMLVQLKGDNICVFFTTWLLKQWISQGIMMQLIRSYILFKFKTKCIKVGIFRKPKIFIHKTNPTSWRIGYQHGLHYYTMCRSLCLL